MNTLWQLVSRHQKMYRRDKSLVFFSLLSVLIVVSLYAIFLQKTQVTAIEQWVPASVQLTSMVNEWMSAGLLSIIGVTSTLTAFGIYVRDMERKVLADFLTTPLSRLSIQMSYVVNAIVIGFILSIMGLISCQLFIVLMGGEWFTFIKLTKLIGIVMLSVLLCSSFNLLLTLMVSTETALSTVSTIVGAAIGFLCGVYVPLAAVPNVVQNIIMLFPISHTAVLFRQVLMEDSLNSVFIGAVEAKQNYTFDFGINYRWGDLTFSSMHSILYILLFTVIFLVFAIWRYRVKHK